MINESELNEDHTNVNGVDYSVKKRQIILMLLAYSAVFGITSVFLPEENSPLNLVLTLPLLFFGFAWCVTDAEEHHRRIGGPMKLMIILLFIVGFPLYVFRSHGLRGFKTIFLTAILVAIMLACAMSTAVATLCLREAVGF